MPAGRCGKFGTRATVGEAIEGLSKPLKMVSPLFKVWNGDARNHADF